MASCLLHSAKKIKTKRAVFAGDFHVPYHDQTAVDLFVNFLAWFKPDEIFLNGDIIDFYQLSFFSQDPSRAMHLQDDIDRAKGMLHHIRMEVPKARILYLFGNHELRLQTYTRSKAPHLASLRNLTVPQLLELDKFKIEHREYGNPYKWHGLLVEHGDRVSKFSGYTAKAMHEHRGMSGISNHVHRLGAHYRTNYAGTHAWYENGCLCQLECFDYTHGLPNWQQGFSVAYAPADGNRFFLEQIPILSGRLLYGGLLWGRKDKPT